MISLMKNSFFNEAETKEKLCKFISVSPKLSMGVFCSEFEHMFAKYQGRKYAVFVNSGSSANLALLQALINLDIIKKNDKVGFSAVTWATNVMPIIQFGLEPVPVDISIETLNIDLESLKKVGSQLNVLFLTNALGFSSEISRIQDYCKSNNTLLLEDNCESLGSIINGKKLGNFGLASTFSFFVGHHLSTIEGGMVCTDDEELYNMLVMVRAHGWSRNVEIAKKEELRKKFNTNKFYETYTFYYLGYNLRPTEINGFLGIEQLKYIDKIVSKRNKIFNMYHNVAKDNPDLINIKVDHMDFVSNFAFPVVCQNKALFQKYLLKFNNVEVRPIIAGDITTQPFFVKLGLTFSCPNAKLLNDFGFYIPNNPDLTDEEVKYICNLLKKDDP